MRKLSIGAPCPLDLSVLCPSPVAGTLQHLNLRFSAFKGGLNCFSTHPLQSLALASPKAVPDMPVNLDLLVLVEILTLGSLKFLSCDLTIPNTVRVDLPHLEVPGDGTAGTSTKR